MKILITGGKTATALKLIKAFEKAEVVLGDYREIPSIKTSTYSFENLGEWNREVLAHNLLTKCLDFGVDTLLPLYEQEIIAVAKSLVLFDEFGVKVLLSENHQLAQKKSAYWAVFKNGDSIYHNLSDDKAISTAKSLHLNGAYYFDMETRNFLLISIPNPS